MINWIDRRYPESGGIWITENGISLGNAYADVDRYQYIYLHFNEILKAIELDGVNVRGSCIWSLMDNFEWIAGFEDHFGIYHVEFNALEDQPAGTDYPDTWAKERFAFVRRDMRSKYYKSGQS